MIARVEFSNFKVLRQAALPLGPFTLLVGPNGSGKSTAMFALHAIRAPGNFNHNVLRTFGSDPETPVSLRVRWSDPPAVYQVEWPSLSGFLEQLGEARMRGADDPSKRARQLAEIDGFRLYSFEPSAIAAPVPLQPNTELGGNGSHLAGVLDRLRDQTPERFDRLNAEIHACLPEFDRVLFDTPTGGQRAFLLRTTRGHHRVPAYDLSHGTLLVLAILTLAHISQPPPLVCLEEPDRGIHPQPPEGYSGTRCTDLPTRNSSASSDRRLR